MAVGRLTSRTDTAKASRRNDRADEEKATSRIGGFQEESADVGVAFSFEGRQYQPQR